MKDILDLEPNDCRFPHGDQDFQFCAAPQHIYFRNGKLVQSSYCKVHHFICAVEPRAKVSA